MRLALAHSHPNTFGGGERAVLEVARGLAPRHDVRLVVGRYEPDRTYAGLQQLPSVQYRGSDWFWRWPDADALLANSFGANLLSLIHGRRVAYWVHSVRSRFLVPGARGAGLRARRILDWLAVRRAGLLVANSQFTAARLKGLYGRAADAVVTPGVGLASLRPGSSRRSGYAITVGRLSPEKGLDRLLQTWRLLPDVELRIAGTGDERYAAELRRLAPANVVFLGALAADRLAHELADASVAVFTPYAEEFGIAPLEAMGSATPVVAWREGGLLETIVDGAVGWLVDSPAELAERVRLLVRDQALRAQMGAAARAHAETFAWPSRVLQIERLLLSLAGVTPGPPSPAPPA